MFQNTTSNHPGRSAFNLSYSKKFTCDMGFLIPTMCEEVVPNDILQIGQRYLIRMAPLVAPIMHNIRYRAYSFFVPSTLMMGRSNDKTRGNTATFGLSPRYPDGEDEWATFITGGPKNDLDITLPLWDATVPATDPKRSIGSLWDYNGFYPGVVPTNAMPLAFSKRAYNLVWYHYFRDENLMFNESNFDIDQEQVLSACWPKDYFTSALPFQQRGISPSFNISWSNVGIDAFLSEALGGVSPGSNTADSVLLTDNNATTGLANLGHLYTSLLGGGNDNSALAKQSYTKFFSDFINAGLGSANVGFNMNDLRLAVQIQRFMELSARTGYRLISFLRAHYGIAPKDETLDRPEYIGGISGDIIISEVLQTSSTDDTSPQGDMAGHGITMDQGFVGSYRAKEHGVVITVFYIYPSAVYQQGINRQWLRRSRYDYYFPEFAHLSEQLISNAEICALDGSNGANLAGFGYQGVFDEMRYKPSMVCGLFRSTLDMWHLSRIFDPVQPPALNAEFVQFNAPADVAVGGPSNKSTVRKDIFAFFAETPDAHGFYVDCHNIIKAVRPMPYEATPGKMDHVF